MDAITTKGIRQGILITLKGEMAWPSLMESLKTWMGERGAFFKGGRCVVDVNHRELSREQLNELSAFLEESGVILTGILTSHDTTRALVKEAGFPTDLNDISEPETPPEDEEYHPQPVDSEEYGTAGVLIRRTLRSGRTIRSAGHVVVIGDVNSGAEIVAVGDIIVWGKLKGTVHAGVEGDESAVVCALDLTPTQLRIASLITIPPNDKRRRKPRPEMACILNGQIEAVPWERN